MRIATRDNKHTRDRRSAQFPVFTVTLLLKSFSLDADELHEDMTEKQPGRVLTYILLGHYDFRSA